jgi:Pyruvate/2-oxoacid:ferredoxin oxidoreductase delta subunit
MTKIVDMQGQIEKKRQKELLEKYRGRVETVQKMIQCSSCHFRCAMCGIQIESGSTAKSPAGLSFCEGCRLEFEEYQDVSKGRKKPEVFWHNMEWLNVWSSWLSYRRAISAFINSREFKLLVEEMNSD